MEKKKATRKTTKGNNLKKQIDKFKEFVKESQPIMTIRGINCIIEEIESLRRLSYFNIILNIILIIIVSSNLK